jgi:pimeloyl-ACP methyl ester carboxylesterase
MVLTGMARYPHKTYSKEGDVLMATFIRHGATIHYTDTRPPGDRPEAATLFFGHGLLFSAWMFHHQIAALRGQFRCVAIDWRGHGESWASESGYDMDTLTDDALALIGLLGVAPVHYVGLSMGGFVGLRIAARRAEAEELFGPARTAECARCTQAEEFSA